MRFIHTADWQIAKTFRFVDAATQSVLQEARLEAINRIAEAARANGANTVLVAGDVFDLEGVAARTLDRPFERMRSQAGITWHLLPGNHDPHRPNGLWDRVLRRGLPDNVRLHLEPVPATIAGGTAALLPAPPTRMHAANDLTEWMSSAATESGLPRIGLAHGSVAQFGGDGQGTRNYIDPARVRSAGLDYLALGDWHGTKRISDRAWYSGTPETDAFDVIDGGNVLLVEIQGPGIEPRVTPIRTGRFRWEQIEITLASAEDIDLLEERLRTLDADPSRLLVDLTVAGTLGLAELSRFEERIVGSVGAALRWLRLDSDALVLHPSAADLDRIAESGFVRATAERLKTLAEDTANPDREIAALALQRLYVEHLRQEAQA